MTNFLSAKKEMIFFQVVPVISTYIHISELDLSVLLDYYTCDDNHRSNDIVTRNAWEVWEQISQRLILPPTPLPNPKGPHPRWNKPKIGSAGQWVGRATASSKFSGLGAWELPRPWGMQECGLKSPPLHMLPPLTKKKTFQSSQSESKSICKGGGSSHFLKCHPFRLEGGRKMSYLFHSPSFLPAECSGTDISWTFCRDHRLWPDCRNQVGGIGPHP